MSSCDAGGASSKRADLRLIARHPVKLNRKTLWFTLYNHTTMATPLLAQDFRALRGKLERRLRDQAQVSDLTGERK